MNDLDTAARSLGRARLAYERRPDDDRAYALYLEAENAFLKAEARHREALLKGAAAREAEMARRVRRMEAEHRVRTGAIWDEVRKLKRIVRRGRRQEAQAKTVLADMFGGAA